ncbi:hypothetical protein OH491_01625 [Termitidicoccus mucosus]|uniref:hypothetical protein n=1 Tax=Termitidicoccus mucosus TaxID=1184151 RepID=UPI0011AB7A3A
MQARFTARLGTASLLGRIVAVLSVLLLATLVIGSVSPEVHDHVCHTAATGHGDDDHCAITTYAGGEVLALALVLTVEPLTVCEGPTLLSSAILAVSQFDYRLQPTRGPPVLS